MAERQPTTSSRGIGRPRQPDEPRPMAPDRPSRYDLVLAGILLVLVGAWVVGQLSSVPIWVAMALGSLLAVPLVADGLAVNPPQ